MKRYILLIALLVLLVEVPARAQFLKGLFINRYDRHNLHHGKWKYKDLANRRRLVCIGWFDHGKQVKEWKYYYNTGQIRFVEQYTWVGDKRLVNVIYFHENGQVSNKGIAMVENDGEKSHYYWEGDWNYFETDGTFVKTVTYNNGQPIKSTYPDGRVEIEYGELPKTKLEIPVR